MMQLPGSSPTGTPCVTELLEVEATLLRAAIIGLKAMFTHLDALLWASLEPQLYGELLLSLEEFVKRPGPGGAAAPIDALGSLRAYYAGLRARSNPSQE